MSAQRESGASNEAGASSGGAGAGDAQRSEGSELRRVAASDRVPPELRARDALAELRRGEPAFQVGRLDATLAWARGQSLRTRPFGGACCAPEWRAAAEGRGDLARFGARVPESEEEQADLLVVMGPISHKLAPWLRSAYEALAPPRFVLAFGACACSGGLGAPYANLAGAERVVPVDVFVPGCPPRPEALVEGLIRLQEKIRDERPGAGRYRWPGALARG